MSCCGCWGPQSYSDGVRLLFSWKLGNNANPNSLFQWPWKANVPGVSTPFKFRWNYSNIFKCQWFRWISKTWHSIKSSWPNDLRIRELVMSWHPRTDMLLLWCPPWEHYLHEWLQVLLCNGVLVLIFLKFGFNLSTALGVVFFWTPPVWSLSFLG